MRARTGGTSTSPNLDDAIVLGAGVMGCSAALALARRGLAVTLVDQRTPGHKGGSSHGDARIFRFSYAEPVYFHLAHQAGALWNQLAKDCGEELLLRCGNWDCGLPDSPEVLGIAANLASQSQPHELLTEEESQRRFPQMSPPAGGRLLFQPDGGILLADRAVKALREAAERSGVRLLTETRIEHFAASEESFDLATDDGRRLGARHLVITAGAWSAHLLAELGLELPLDVTREQAAYFRPSNGTDHTPRSMPTVIDWGADRHLYALPAVSEDGVKAGWHHGGAPLDDPDAPAELDEANLEIVRDFVRRRFPHLDLEPTRIEHCLYTNTPDEHFLIDRHPLLPRLAFGAGFSGHGFKFAPAIGEMLATLALGEELPDQLSGFSLDRFG